MTASTIEPRPMPATGFGHFPGLSALIRKDITEWVRGQRAWVVFTITTLFMVLTAANAWIVTQLRLLVPPDGNPPAAPETMEPLANLGAAIGTQIFVLAAIFAVASLIVRERENGTLAWVASKPVSRSSIWLSKWVAASGMLALAAVLAPIMVTLAVVSVLYGLPAIVPVLVVTVGATATAIFYAAFGLAAGTILPGQPAVVAAGFAIFALAPIVGGLFPLPIAPFLPTAILEWSMGVASGADVGWVTPIAFVVWTAAIVGLAVRQMRRIEL